MCLHTIAKGISCPILFLCFCGYSSHFISVLLKLNASIFLCQMVNIKIFLIKRHDEQVFIYHYLLNKRDGKRTERHRKYDRIYLTFSENSTKNDIIYCHCSWLFPLVLYHYFLKSSVLLSKLVLTLKYMLSVFSCSQNQD